VARGNYLLMGATEEATFIKAHELMKRAVRIDSTYAEAYVGVALSVVHRQFMGLHVPEALITEADQAIAKALELDPSSGRAYAARGNLYWIEGKIAECIGAHERAFELNPRDGFIVANYSWMMMLRGKYDDGIVQGERAVELDPLSQYVRCNLMGWYYARRRFREAESQALKILEIDSTWEPALNQLAMLCEHEGRYDEARMWWMKDLQRLGYDTMSLARSGSWKEFRSLRTAMYKRAGNHDALVFSLLLEGDTEGALKALAKCVELKSSIVMVLFYPDFDPLRDDPRFEALVAEAQLPVSAYCVVRGKSDK
jgi:adenylate cyclase